MARLRNMLVGALLVGIAATSCSEAGSELRDTVPQTTTLTSEPSTATSKQLEQGTAPGQERFDIAALLAKDPLVIFNAYPPKPEHITYALPRGQHDFDELWRPGAPWQTALEQVDIYRLHAFQLRHFMDDEQVKTLIEFLDEHEIPLMLETEPLLPPDPDECAHTESYEAPWDLEMAVRLKELGGHIDIIAIEEPYHFAHLLDTPEACRYTVERIVDEVLQHVGNLRELFGEIPVGTIEPIWASPATEPRDMEIWLDTFEEIAGEPFAFLHVDPNWYRPDWAEVAVGIEAVADARGVPFGILYNGGVETDGLTWMNFMMANAAELEVVHGGTPQHVSFQSWVDWPDHALPEDDLTALTSGIVRYFGQRVDLSVEATDQGIEARLVDLEGQPVEGVQLTVRRTSTVDSFGSQTVRGVVPDGITEALILVRANAEDATTGNVAATLFDVSFTTEEGGSNLVPNGSFDDGTDQWGIYGSHPEGVRAVTVGSDAGLAVTAPPDRDIFIDGTTFPVSAGSEFELSATYGLDGGSPNSVVVSVAFVGVSRANIFLHPLPEDIGEFVTDANGVVHIPGDVIGGGPATIVVVTNGNLEHWPATASMSVD